MDNKFQVGKYIRTIEIRNKMKLAHLDKHFSEEHKRKLKGRIPPNKKILPIDVIIKEYQSGKTSKEIGSNYHVSDVTILNRLKIAGIPRRGPKIFNKGKKASLETKNKMSIGIIKSWKEKHLFSKTLNKISNKEKLLKKRSIFRAFNHILNLDSCKQLQIISLYNQGFGLVKIARQFKQSSKLIRTILVSHNIHIRTISETNKMLFNKGLRRNWCEGLTKETNNSLKKISEDRKGPKNKMFNKEFSPEHRRKLKEDITSRWKNSDYKDKMKENLLQGGLRLKEYRKNQIFPVKDTSIEVKIQNYLKALGIDFFTHQYIKEIEHGYQCDILIPSMNLVIECDGDYWHKYPIGNDLDHIRTKELMEKGFKVLRLWECEINKMNLQQFKDKLR